jgi:glutamate synthase domain-containing protein 2
MLLNFVVLVQLEIFITLTWIMRMPTKKNSDDKLSRQHELRSRLRESATYPREVIAEIQRAAETGIYDIRGWGAKRKVPNFDDLLFLGASMSRYPLEGYREKCTTSVTLGTRFASKPIELKIPITVAGMSFGALSGPAKEALGRGASAAGTSTTTGDGGMTPEERENSDILVYQLLPSRYGMNPDDLRRADAIEVVVGQGAKPGGGGMLLGQKISERVAGMRDLPEGIDQRSACRHPDWTGPDDLAIKIQELREITNWEKPIYIKVQLVVSGGIRSGADVAKALAMGADAVSVGVAALIALGDNSPQFESDYNELGSSAGFYDDWHEGLDPSGISTQDEELAARFDPVLGGRRLANYLNVLTLETQTLARANGKSHVHNLEPEDLVALTIEASAMAGVPLAGTDWIPGKNSF